jgi:hypothetical protein
MSRHFSTRLLPMPRRIHPLPNVMTATRPIEATVVTETAPETAAATETVTASAAIAAETVVAAATRTPRTKTTKQA